jgi:photosystem II stability/assembly factor-like uncharacterized protein
MFKRFARHTHALGLFSLLLAMLACSIQSPAETLTPGTATSSAATNTAPATLAPVASPAIRHFKMLDANNGWALSDTSILRTTDGGLTWRNATPGGLGSVGYPASFFMDTVHAWLVIPGADFTSGSLYRTQDGGASWSSASVPFSGGDLKFLDSNNGFILASLGAGAGSEAVAAFQTGDGGSTWTRNYTNDPNASGAGDSLPLGGIKSGMTFRDPIHGWVSGQTPVDDFVYFYVSADAGHTWAQQNVVLPPAEHVMMGADAPIFFDQSSGLLPVTSFADTSSTLFFATTDGGTTWMPTSAAPISGRYSVISRQEAVVWDGGPLLYATHDGMLTWAEVHPNISLVDNLSGLQFIDTNTGWALGTDASSHATMYKTADGGATWAAIP